MRHLGVALKWLPISSQSQGATRSGGSHAVRQAGLFVNPSAPANKVFQFLSHNKRHQVFAPYLPQVSPLSSNCLLRQRLWRRGKMKLWMCVGTTAPQTPKPNAARCSPGTAWHRSLPLATFLSCLLPPRCGCALIFLSRCHKWRGCLAGGEAFLRFRMRVSKINEARHNGNDCQANKSQMNDTSRRATVPKKTQQKQQQK